MSTRRSVVRWCATRAIPWIFTAACASPVLAQDSAAVQPDADVQPPILQSLNVAGSVNAQVPHQYITVTISLTDDVSGVASYLVNFRSPSGAHHVTRLKTIAVPRTKVKSEITVGAVPFSELAFLKFSEPGTWKVYSLSTTDVAGNTRSYSEAQLNSIGGVHTFQVTNGGGYDTIAPTLASGNIDTINVRLSKAPKGAPPGTPPYVSAQVSMTDSGTGVVSGTYLANLMFCVAGSGSCQSGATNTFTMTGTSNRTGLTANTMSISTQLAPNQMLGNYLIYSLELVDVAGNPRTSISSDFGGGTDFHSLFPQGVAIFVAQ